jgi:type I restriction enzyme S subunit
MSKEKKNKVEPKLRFPEFKGGWSFEHGDILFDQVSNKNHSSDLPLLAITQEYGAIPRDKIDYNVVVTDKSIESYKVVEVGDFIISLRSFQGGIEYSAYRGICSPAYIILRKKHDVEDGFYKYYLKTKLFINDLNKNIEGIRDGKMVSYKQFSELQLPRPSKHEQQKIAVCLSSLDDLITAETEKLIALKVHKKALMQNLFPQAGETLPKLRFPQFGDSGEWDKKSLQEILVEGRLGGNYENSDANSGIPVIKMGNLERGGMNIKKIQFLPKEWEYNSDDILKNNDLLLNTRNTLELVGKVAIWKDELPIALYNSNLLKMSFHKDFIASNIFMNYFFNTRSTILSLRSVATGTTSVAAIYTKDLLTLKVDFPSLLEQQKIADCLSSLDEMITAQTEKIDTLKLHKRGLMQQLFPSANKMLS